MHGFRITEYRYSHHDIRQAYREVSLQCLGLSLLLTFSYQRRVCVGAPVFVWLAGDMLAKPLI
jgi:hypothetical protein